MPGRHHQTVANRGAVQLFASVRLFSPAAVQARRRARPGQGSGGLPFALLRVPCDARVPGPWPNSLRSLHSLRSNKRPQVRARGARVRAWPATLCFSAAPIRPAQAAPGALRAREFLHGAGEHPTPPRPLAGAHTQAPMADYVLPQRADCSPTFPFARGRSCTSARRESAWRRCAGRRSTSGP